MRTNSNLETLWDLVWIENKGICSRKKTRQENELYAQRRRSSRRHKTKTINERKKKKNKIQNHRKNISKQNLDSYPIDEDRQN